MLVSESVVSSRNRLDSQLAFGSRNRKQFAAREFFWGAAFVRIHVSGLAANHGMVRTLARADSAKDIGASSVEYK